MSESISDREGTANTRLTRLAHLLVGMASVVGLIVLICAVESFPTLEGIEGVPRLKVIGTISAMWLFIAVKLQLYQMGDRLDKWWNPGCPASSTEPIAAEKQPATDWFGAMMAVFTFVTTGLLIFFAGHCFDTPKRPRTYSPAEVEEVRKIIAARLTQTGQFSQPYWQTTVTDLHEVRFKTPSTDEPANKTFERTFQILESLTIRAKATSTARVDGDLVTMVQKHLAIEDQIIELKRRIDELMQRERIVSDGNTIGDRMVEWQNIVATVQANPAMIDKLPEEGRRLFGEVIELDQKRMDQFREIEIMQAVLQERYKPTTFLLPEVAQ